MKRSVFLYLPVLCLLLTGCGDSGGGGSPWPWILGILSLPVLLLAGLRVDSYLRFAKRRRTRGRPVPPLDRLTKILCGVGALLLVGAVLTGVTGGNPDEQDQEQDASQQQQLQASQEQSDKGWQTDENGKRYYLLDGGERATGWMELENRLYYFDENGLTLSGWKTMDDLQYYFRKDGSAARGEETIGGEVYYFDSKGREIILVNAWNEVPRDYEVELTALTGTYGAEGVQVSTAMEQDLKAMVDACNSASGATCCAASGYRTMEDQTNIYNNQVQIHLNAGMERTEAEKEAATRVAIPGTSEHQLGLAVDIIDTSIWEISAIQETLPAVQWLMVHAHEYGFILRYPAGKTNVTGIIYEPWHYRYVGRELSAELHSLGLTLEEYVATLD